MGFDSLTPTRDYRSMNATDKRRIEKLMEDSIMEMPIGFEVGGVHYCLYPVTLGTAYLISREREWMAENLKEVFFDLSEKERIDYRRSMCRIVAIQTLGKKDDILDSTTLLERTNSFYQSLDNDGLFQLYDLIMTSFDDASFFIRHSGIEYDKQKLAKIAKYKSEEGNFTFGARTAYGSIIGPACEKFGWSLDYVVWGIGYTNLQMLLADEQVSVYLSKEDRKKLKISADREIIDANDPANIERMKQILKGGQ